MSSKEPCRPESTFGEGVSLKVNLSGTGGHLLECDRWGEHYDFPPTCMRGERVNHFICPLCYYDLKKIIDDFAGNRQEENGRKICGHKYTYIRIL